MVRSCRGGGENPRADCLSEAVARPGLRRSDSRNLTLAGHSELEAIAGLMNLASHVTAP
jgi:hypothetical protein